MFLPVVSLYPPIHAKLEFSKSTQVNSKCRPAFTKISEGTLSDFVKARFHLMQR